MAQRRNRGIDFSVNFRVKQKRSRIDLSVTAYAYSEQDTITSVGHLAVSAKTLPEAIVALRHMCGDELVIDPDAKVERRILEALDALSTGS